MELNIDFGKFIQAVEERPTLYVHGNRRDSDWQLERRRRWQEVAEIVLERPPQDISKVHITALKKKWISLRDQFVKACKSRRKFGSGEPGKKKSKYIYYERLMFLAPHVKNGDMFTCSPPHDDEDYEGMIELLAHSSDDDSVNINLSDDKEKTKEEYVEEESPTINVKNRGIKRPRKPRESHATIQGYTVPVPIEEPYSIPVQDPFPAIVQEVQPPKLEGTESFPGGPSTSTTNEQVESIVSATARGFASVLNMNSINTEKKREIDDDPMGHKTFLMSCLPFFNGMSQMQILKARSKIITAIEEVSANNSTPTMTITSARSGRGVPPGNQTFEGISIEEHDTRDTIPNDRKWL